MSPGADGARLTHPPPRCAVKVLRKNDSPPSILLRPPKMLPEPMPVVMSTPSWATIAPGSALTTSPGSSSSVSRL